MTQLINKYYLICIFLCVPFLGNAQLLKGDSLFQVGKFYEASIAYERALFTNDKFEDKNLLLLKKSYCLKAMGDYDGAYKLFFRGNLFSGSDSLNYLMRYELVLNAYLAGSFDIAYNNIKQLKHFTTSTEAKTKATFLEILILNEIQKWDEAQQVLLEYNESIDAGLNVDSLYNFKRRPKIRSIKKTETLATFEPSTVLLREGAILAGLFSVSTRAGAIYVIIDQLSRGYFFSGAFTTAAIYFILYQGGYKYAMKVTKDRNQRKIDKYNNRIRNALLHYELTK